MGAAATILNTVPDLLGGQPSAIRARAREWEPAAIAGWLLLILVGAGSYGAAMGIWRAPEQALFNAIKFPLVILGTAVGNALINGMLGPLLGVQMRARESFMLILMSFAAASAILGSFAPLLFFQVWNIPPMEAAESRLSAHGLILLTQVAVVAFAGIVANVKLFRTLQTLASSPGNALSVLVAWLTVNLFLGAQLCWNARPFIGSPDLPVQFLRPDAFDGNFFEAVAIALRNVTQ